MRNEPLGNQLITLFYMPSFYGAFTWGIWLSLYLMRLIRLDACSGMALAIYIATEIFFVLSMALSYPHYRGTILADHSQPGDVFPSCERRTALKLTLLLFHLAGLLGLSTWLMHIAGYLGGFNLVLLALTSAADTIRGASDLSSTIGIQVSFLGWIAIALTVYAVARKQVSKWWLVLALIQFLGNFLYIGRTQPIWIMFTSLLMVLAALVSVNFRKAVMWTLLILVLFFALFWAIGEWTGKAYYEDKFEDPRIPGVTQVMYAYGVSGFAYFNHMLVHHEPVSYSPERVLYPVSKLLSRFGLIQEPPSQILEFYAVPFETNVGSFLEPFYRDGGLLFVVFGILVYSFGLDILGLKLLQSGSPIALFAWANLCFTTFMGFFTPLLAEFPVWLFIGLGLFSVVIQSLNTDIFQFRAGGYES